MLLNAAAANVPSWTDKLEAWSTFGGAVFTAGAVVVAFLVWRHDRSLRREDKLDADAAQARLVFATSVKAVGDSEAGWTGIVVSISNNSENSIFDVAVRVTADGLTKFLHGSRTVDEVQPDASHRVEVRFGEPGSWRFTNEGALRHELASWVEASVEFTDRAGLRWLRYGRSSPTKARTLYVRTGTPTLLVEYLRLRVPLRLLNNQRQIMAGRIWMHLQRRVQARPDRSPKLPPDAD